MARQSEALKVQRQFDVAYTHWSNGAEAMVMILFWSIGMGSVMKKHAEVSSGDIFASEFAVKELRKLRLTRALTSRLPSEYGISLRFATCEFALVLVGCQAHSFDWNSLWGCCSQIYQGVVLGLACRLLDDDLGSPGHPGG